MMIHIALLNSAINAPLRSHIHAGVGELQLLWHIRSTMDTSNPVKTDISNAYICLMMDPSNAYSCLMMDISNAYSCVMMRIFQTPTTVS